MTRGFLLPHADSPVAVSLRVVPSANVSRGASFSVECRAEGLPAPTFGWALPPAPNLRFGADNRSVAVARAAAANRGVYTCTASNRHGRRAGSVVVRVDGEPKAQGYGGHRGWHQHRGGITGVPLSPRREPAGLTGVTGRAGRRHRAGVGGGGDLLPEDDGVQEGRVQREGRRGHLGRCPPAPGGRRGSRGGVWHPAHPHLRDGDVPSATQGRFAHHRVLAPHLAWVWGVPKSTGDTGTPKPGWVS